MAQAPDVRVRLSAEGVDEVVRALSRVKAAADSAGKSGKGFQLMNDALGDMKGLLPALGVAAAVGGIVSLTKNALESADALGKLEQKTGISTKTLSVLNVAADLADESFEGMSKGLIKFNKNMDALDSGSAEAGESVRKLFGNSQALKGLDTESRLRKTVDALGGMESGARKTGLAMAFFGKSGADLIPMIDDLANGGFDKFAEKAKKLGKIVDKDLAEAAQKANDNIKELKIASEGAATQFAAGLAPALAKASGALVDAFTAAGDENNGLKLLGEGIGWLVKAVVFGFEVVGKYIGANTASWMEYFDILGDMFRGGKDIVAHGFEGITEAIKAGSTGNIKGAVQALKGAGEAVGKDVQAMTNRYAEATQRSLAIYGELWKDVKGDYAKLFGDQKEEDDPKKKGGKGGDTQDTAAMKAQQARLQAHLEQELALIQKNLSIEQQKAQEAYQDGALSLAAYYAERRSIIERESDAEIKTLEAKRRLAQRTVTSNAAEAIQKAAAIDAIDSQIALKRLDTTQKLDALDNEHQQKVIEFKKKQLDIENQIATAQGDTYAAAINSIKLQAEELKRARIDPETIGKLSDALSAKAKSQELSRVGSNAMAGLGVDKAALDNRVASGELFPYQAVEEYRKKVQDILPELKKLADSQRQAAVTPEEILAAEQYKNQIEALGISVNESALQMAQFKQSVESSLQSGLTEYLSKGIDQAENFGDAMRGMALSVVDSLRQVAAQMLATYLMQQTIKAAKGMFGGGGDDPASGAAAGAAQAAPLMVAATETAAAGGAIAVGAGSLMAAAIVLQAAADTLLIANSMSAGMGFADGGLVSGPGTGTSDSIPARLSNGEFVVRSAAVAQPGMLAHLASINRGMGTAGVRGRGGVARFATGGIVQAGDAMGGGGGIKASFGLEPGVIMKHVESYMRSPEGQHIQIENLGKNQKRASKALGR